MKNQLKMLLLSTTLAVALTTQALAAGMIDQPRTGQTKCYDAAGKDAACSGTGQDGELRSGVAIPVPRFKDKGDGTVLDKVTGLIWLKNANCFGAKYFTDALTSAATLATGACGLADGSKAGDWRLPNRNEMMSIIDVSRVNPALQLGHPFVNVVNDKYRTSSSYAGDTIYSAWLVHVGSGAADYGSIGNNNKNYNNYVWPVRAGQ